MDWTHGKWEEALKSLYRRAATDEGFRRLCLEDASAAMKEISGLGLPEGAKVRFVERLEEQVLVLPPFQGGREDELSDEELEKVAGGEWQMSDYTGPNPGGGCVC